MTANETCSDCSEPATVDQYAGRWFQLGRQWIDMKRPLCDRCAANDAHERAEKRAS